MNIKQGINDFECDDRLKNSIACDRSQGDGMDGRFGGENRQTFSLSKPMR